MGVGEGDAMLGEAVEIGGGNAGGGVEGLDITVAEVIGEDEEDVGLLRSGDRSPEPGTQTKKKTKKKKEMFHCCMDG